eukprot:87534-Prorocentrum_minimum.AAC.1
MNFTVASEAAPSFGWTPSGSVGGYHQGTVQCTVQLYSTVEQVVPSAGVQARDGSPLGAEDPPELIGYRARAGVEGRPLHRTSTVSDAAHHLRAS